MSEFTPILPLDTERAKRANRAAWQVGVTTLILLALFAISILAAFGGDPMVFVNKGERFDLGIPDGRNGSDGQYPYYMAAEGIDALKKMDFPPSFRYQRILYPAIAAALALWQPDFVPWTMLLINLVSSAVAVGFLAYLLVMRTRVTPWLALLPALWVGNLICVRYDMIEPLAMAFSMAAVFFYYRRKIAWTALMAFMTALTKEVGLVLVVGLILHALWNKRWFHGILIAVAGFVPYAIWAWIMARWLQAGIEATQSGRQMSLIPFYGVTGSFSPVFLTLGLVWVLVPATILGIFALLQWFQKKDKFNILETFMLATSALFIIFVPPETFKDLPSLVRYSQPFIIAAILYVACVRPRWIGVLVVLWLPTLVLGLLVAFTTLK